MTVRLYQCQLCAEVKFVVNGPGISQAKELNNFERR